MPYKNVSGLKRVATLDGEITALCVNKQLGVALAGSTNLVQIAWIPLTGVNARTISVSLDEVRDIALLSRDLAVVRCNHAAWALVDLQHKPQVEEIAQDIKSIVQKPQGGSALALKWDNRAAELAPGKNEVAVRDFTMRGEVKCADVGETECYVVTDTNEFRIHPGQTPEQGSTTKVQLPDEAKSLDQVRGSKFLSVVYKRNSSNVAIVKRAGNRLDVKYVHLGRIACDIVVSETSFLVATNDGKVALFDADSVDKATPSLIEPKFEAPLNCQGEPRIITMSAATVFVGTSGGEVYQGTAIRKQMMS